MIDNKMTTLINKFSAMLENPASITPAKIIPKRAKKHEGKTMDLKQHLQESPKARMKKIKVKTIPQTTKTKNKIGKTRMKV